MNDLLVLRDAVVASLKVKLGSTVDVDSHGGTFDTAEVKRFATKAPAVRVAITGVGRTSRYADGRLKLPVRFAAVVFTRDTATGGDKIPRDTAALLLATAVELAVGGNRFGCEGVFQPTDLEARSEYSGPVDTLGVALWQVTWTSDALIGEPEQPLERALFDLHLLQVGEAHGGFLQPDQPGADAQAAVGHDIPAQFIIEAAQRVGERDLRQVEGKAGEVMPGLFDVR